MESQNSSQETWRYKIRELLWPLLDKEPEETMPPLPEVVTSSEVPIVITDENLDQAFALMCKFADGEEERRKAIESKATLFLSTISIATTLVLASNTLLANNTEKSWHTTVWAGASFALTLYAVSTVWFSIRALERGNYSVLSFNDLNHAGDANEYKKHLISSIRDITQSNYKTINSKVDCVTLAQEHYKRAVILIAFYALLVFALFLFYKPTLVDKMKKKEIARVIQNT